MQGYAKDEKLNSMIYIQERNTLGQPETSQH